MVDLLELIYDDGGDDDEEEKEEEQKQLCSREILRKRWEFHVWDCNLNVLKFLGFKLILTRNTFWNH